MEVSKLIAGFLMEKELEYLGKAITEPSILCVDIGGTKVSDKIPVINALIDRGVNKLLISGAMAYTFLKAEGFTVGKSLIEDSMLQTVLDIKKRAEEKGIEFLLPTDHQVVDSYKPVKDRHETIPIEFTNMILDWWGNGYRRRDSGPLRGCAPGL